MSWTIVKHLRISSSDSATVRHVCIIRSKEVFDVECFLVLWGDLSYKCKCRPPYLLSIPSVSHHYLVQCRIITTKKQTKYAKGLTHNNIRLQHFGTTSSCQGKASQRVFGSCVLESKMWKLWGYGLEQILSEELLPSKDLWSSSKESVIWRLHICSALVVSSLSYFYSDSWKS